MTLIHLGLEIALENLEGIDVKEMDGMKARREDILAYERKLEMNEPCIYIDLL